MRRELMESKNGIESALANLIQLSSERDSWYLMIFMMRLINGLYLSEM